MTASLLAIGWCVLLGAAALLGLFLGWLAKTGRLVLAGKAPPKRPGVRYWLDLYVDGQWRSSTAADFLDELAAAAEAHTGAAIIDDHGCVQVVIETRDGAADAMMARHNLLASSSRAHLN